jgi:hypothetical protein
VGKAEGVGIADHELKAVQGTGRSKEEQEKRRVEISRQGRIDSS